MWIKWNGSYKHLEHCEHPKDELLVKNVWFLLLTFQSCKQKLFCKTQSEYYRDCATCFSVNVPLKRRINTDGYTCNAYDLFYLVKYLFDQTVR